MASPSTSSRARPPSVMPIVLPSIHEMFPEHMMMIPRDATPISPPPAPVSHPHYQSPSYSFDVLKSDPAGSSLQHIASSRPRPSRPVVRTTTRPQTASSDGDTEIDADDGEEEGFDGFPEESKKHVCPTCAKRFNRPSSLRIHVNTHTGATPFRCPHPNCGRAFNVNSNMRRHLRNHATPGPNPPFSTSTPSSPSPSPLYSPAASHPSPYDRWSAASAPFPVPPPSAPWSPSYSYHYSSSSSNSQAPQGYSESDIRSQRGR